MIKQDGLVQWLCSNETKIDQLKFVYIKLKSMMDSPLRSILCDPAQNKKLIEDVIPKYLAYHAIKNIMDIN